MKVNVWEWWLGISQPYNIAILPCLYPLYNPTTTSIMTQMLSKTVQTLSKSEYEINRNMARILTLGLEWLVVVGKVSQTITREQIEEDKLSEGTEMGRPWWDNPCFVETWVLGAKLQANVYTHTHTHTAATTLRHFMQTLSPAWKLKQAQLSLKSKSRCPYLYMTLSLTQMELNL
jgi:hypothetical protein